MDTNKLLYWSPVFRWEIVDGCLKIELFNYGQQFSGLFPEFYFYTQKGILEEDLIEKMSYKNNPLIKPANKKSRLNRKNIENFIQVEN